MRCMTRVMNRTFFSLRAKLTRLPTGLASPIPQHELVDEECVPAYSPCNYYPAKPGEILARHYQLLVKVGWGSRSTVWLARDTTR